MSSYTIFVVVILVYLCYTWMKKKYSYWRDRGIKGPSPWPVVGNFANVMTFKESCDDLVNRIYKEFPNENIVGIYQAFKPTILLRDPEIIKQILITEFASFQDRGTKYSKDPINYHLYVAEGDRWRALRQKLTPIFTPGKIKGMIPLIENCVNEFINYVHGLVNNHDELEIRALAGQYTLEVIGSTAFGVEMDAFSEKKNVFTDIAEKIYSPSIFSQFVHFVDIIIPGARIIAEKFIIGDSKRITSFFIDLVHKIAEVREGKPKMRKDFMDMMIELKEQGVLEKKYGDRLCQLEINETLIAAQAFIFYAAGFRTASAAMSFLIHELTLHQNIQDHIFREICEVEEKYGKITYESLAELPQLEMALDETFRKYPIVHLLQRKANADYELPGSNLKIAKGTPIMIPVNGLHHDPHYFENPEVFDPNRFSPENKEKIPQCAYLPFGEGPRNCIAMRFAKVQSMLGMAALLKNFKLNPSEKTTKEQSYVKVLPDDDKEIWVKLSRRF